MKKITDEEARQILKEKYNDEYTIIDTYETDMILITVFHKKCGQTYKTKLSTLRKGRVHECCSKTKKMTQNEFNKRVYDEVGSEYLFLEPYVNSSTKILCHHEICGYEWKVKPNHFIGTMKTRCPKCNLKISRGEQNIINWLTQRNFEFAYQYSHPELPNLIFDFMIPLENGEIALIEFDGTQHTELKFNMSKEEFEKQKNRDKLKDSFCLEKGILLIRISYSYRDNIEVILNSYFI